MEAPRSWAFAVTIREPTQITTKTVVNTWEVCFAGAFDDSISASDRQINSGPLDDAISVRSDENVSRRVSPQLLTTASSVQRLGGFNSCLGSFKFLENRSCGFASGEGVWVISIHDNISKNSPQIPIAELI